MDNPNVIQEIYCCGGNGNNCKTPTGRTRFFHIQKRYIDHLLIYHPSAAKCFEVGPYKKKQQEEQPPSPSSLPFGPLLSSPVNSFRRSAPTSPTLNLSSPRSPLPAPVVVPAPAVKGYDDTVEELTSGFTNMAVRNKKPKVYIDESSDEQEDEGSPDLKQLRIKGLCDEIESNKRLLIDLLNKQNSLLNQVLMELNLI